MFDIWGYQLTAVFISYFMLSTYSNFSSEVTNMIALVGMILQTPSKYLNYGVSSRQLMQESRDQFAIYFMMITCVSDRLCWDKSEEKSPMRTGREPRLLQKQRFVKIVRGNSTTILFASLFTCSFISLFFYSYRLTGKWFYS